jgi:hypothetical protein
MAKDDWLEPHVCPRCSGVMFEAHACGEDGTDAWTAWSCRHCGLWFSGLTERWLVDVWRWQDEAGAVEYVAPG